MQQVGSQEFQQGLGRCQFQVADALAMPFEDDAFDLVWSMESGEHMPDKRQFVKELARVCKPGGTILVVMWCHRNLEPGEEALTTREEKLRDSLRVFRASLPLGTKEPEQVWVSDGGELRTSNPNGEGATAARPNSSAYCWMSAAEPQRGR